MRKDRLTDGASVLKLRSRTVGLAALLAAIVCLGRGLAFAAGTSEDAALRRVVRAERLDFDTQRGIAIVVGNVQFMSPGSSRLILADAGVVWVKRKEAYLEGNIRICQTLGAPAQPGQFDLPPPDLEDRTGLEPAERLERAGDLGDLLAQPEKPQILIDTRVPVSQAERVYVNWADGTAYLVKPKLRFADADRVAVWTVTAPSVEGIATYRVPIRDAAGKFTGKYQRRTHYVARNATFTACSFRDPHTHFSASYAQMVEHDHIKIHNIVARVGDVPLLYFPYASRDFEYHWPRLRFALGRSSRLGNFLSVMARFEPVKDFQMEPRLELMSERGVGMGLAAEYEFGQDDEIRGVLDAFWIPTDKGADELADTSRPGSGWPAGWTPAVAAAFGPRPADIPLGLDNRYRVKFIHQQESPKGWEIDLEVHKLSDAGIYREYFEEEFKTEKPPETRLHLKYGRDNWAVFLHLKKRINDFLTQTEYLPQVGFNVIAQPLGDGFLFSSDTEFARVTTRFGDVRRRLGQTNLAITRIWLRRNEYSRPAALTLRQDDSDRLTGWRFDTLNVISRPFEWSIFEVEPFVGWRFSWFEHGIESIRGSYAAVLPAVGPALPAAVAAAPRRTGDEVRNQVLFGGKVSTQFHRVYDVSDRGVLRRLFPHGQRHIITPEMTYTFESRPTKQPRHLPDNDDVTSQTGLHRLNFALRNRWQTRWAPDISRDPRAPLGGEWHRRKLAVEMARASDPVDIIDLDADIDLFLNPRRDNRHLRGKRVRRLSNLRTDLAVRASKETSLFCDTEFALENGQFEVAAIGVRRQPRPDLAYSVSYQYHFHDASLVQLDTQWVINPKWRLGVDVANDFGGGGSWDRTLEITRCFHEWELTLGYEFDKGKRESLGTIHIAPTRAVVHRPSWRFQPRGVAAFQLAETAR